MRTAIVTPLAALAAGLLSLPGQAQVKPITDNGAAEGLSPDVVNFEPEYRDRSARDAGIAVPAPPGTIPSPPDPHDLNGIWIAGKVYPIGRKGGPDLGAGPHAPVDPGIRTAGVYGVGHRHIPQALCLPHSPFAMGLPSKIIETPKVIYILRNGQDGTGYRRRRFGRPLGGRHAGGRDRGPQRADDHRFLQRAHRRRLHAQHQGDRAH
jgi:hypothetical protein